MGNIFIFIYLVKFRINIEDVRVFTFSGAASPYPQIESLVGVIFEHNNKPGYFEQ